MSRFGPTFAEFATADKETHRVEAAPSQDMEGGTAQLLAAQEEGFVFHRIVVEGAPWASSHWVRIADTLDVWGLIAAGDIAGGAELLMACETWDSLADVPGGEG
jgi:hypothetical protein